MNFISNFVTNAFAHTVKKINVNTDLDNSFGDNFVENIDTNDYTLLFDESVDLIDGVETKEKNIKLNDKTVEMLLDKNYLLENKKFIIISMFGKSRVGKSSYMNIICSKYIKKNLSPYVVSSGVDQCTKGVMLNILYNNNEVILLLDFRGTDNGDSSQDIYLSMFAYLVSDIVVISEMKMLYNSTLKTNLEPAVMIAGKTKNIKNTHKHLIFRIIDSTLTDEDKNMSDILNTLLNNPIDDQFKMIREAVKKIYKYKNISGIETLCEKKERQLLRDKNYIDLLTFKENGFDDSIDKISNIISTIQKNNLNSELLIDIFNDVIQLIKFDKDINEDIFDNYENYASSVINKWIITKRENINIINEDIQNISSGLQIVYDKYLEKLYSYNELKYEYFTKFDKLNDVGVKEELFKNEFEKPFHKLETEKNLLLSNAKKYIVNHLEKNIETVLYKYIDIFNQERDYNDNYNDNFIQKINEKIKDLIIYKEKYCEIVENKINIFVTKFINYITTKLVNCIDHELQVFYNPFREFIENEKSNLSNMFDEMYANEKIDALKCFDKDNFYTKSLLILKELINGKINDSHRFVIESIDADFIINYMNETINKSDFLNNNNFDFEFQINEFIKFKEINYDSFYNEIKYNFMSSVVIPKLNEYENNYIKDKEKVLINYCLNYDINKDNDVNSNLNKLLNNNKQYNFLILDCVSNKTNLKKQVIKKLFNKKGLQIIMMNNILFVNDCVDTFIKNHVCPTLEYDNLYTYLFHSNTSNIGKLQSMFCINYINNQNDEDDFIIEKIYNRYCNHTIFKKPYTMFKYTNIKDIQTTIDIYDE